jgi:hypothetical protein
MKINNKPNYSALKSKLLEESRNQPFIEKLIRSRPKTTEEIMMKELLVQRFEIMSRIKDL